MSSLAEPYVAATSLPGWAAVVLEKPKIAESSGAVFASWAALRKEADEAVFVSGCLATPIPGWVDDMRPAVEGRTVALAGAAAGKITGAPVDARAAGDLLALRAASNLDGPAIGHARTFVGFDTSRVFTCFAACVSKHAAGAAECERSVSEARLLGSLAPPRPGLALRGATWAVHHPQPVAAGVLGLVVAVGIGAVAFRRRPRSTIHR